MDRGAVSMAAASQREEGVWRLILAGGLFCRLILMCTLPHACSRYSEFFSLNRILMSYFPVLSAELPVKKAIGNKDLAHIETRKKALGDYLRVCRLGRLSACCSPPALVFDGGASISISNH